MRVRALKLALLFAVLVSSIFSPVQSQEVDCTVQVNYEAVATTHKELLVDFASDVRQYVNNYKWGPDDLDQKIKCTINIFIKGVVGENRYAAQAFVGSQRQIYGQEKSTAVMRLFDETWEFTYVKNRPLNHNLYQFNDLASFLDYYVYLMLGYDYDTYENMGGTQFLQKASDIASLGRSSGGKGWQPTTGSYSRLQIIDEILNPKFSTIRSAIFSYHFKGLDSLKFNPARARENVLRALEAIGSTKGQIDPRNLFVKSFFETKYLEIADLFYDHPDPNIYYKLTLIDQAHQSTYDQYRNRKK